MNDPLEEHLIPLREQLAEAQLELHRRRSMYPRQVSASRMTQAKADHQIRVQVAIVETLRGLMSDT